MKTAIKNCARPTLWALWIVCFLPMILAGLLYYTPAIHWLKPKTNGLLLKVPVSVAMLELSTKTWQLWYVVGESCDRRCQTDLNQLRNAQKSLGKEQHRVTLRTVVPSAALPFLKPGTLAIVDPLDWLMLYYEPGMPYKGMLSDLKRLLKYSHIG